MLWHRAVYEGTVLDHGTISSLRPFYLQFLVSYALIGGMALVLLVVGLTRLGGGGPMSRGFDSIVSYPDRRWLAFTLCLAAFLPILWRRYVLLDMPVADDEAVYRFTAELLASGRLYVASPPLKIFFDQSFMINDGHYYGQYFLGWPILLAPFHWLGLSGIANGFFHAFGVMAVFLTLRLQLGSGWAKVASWLALFSPLLFYNAATLLSHSSCFAALAWMSYCLLRASSLSRESSVLPPRSALWSALACFCFCVAFFIRPQSALPVGGPLLCWWLYTVLRRPDARRWTAILGFVCIALPMAGLFLTVNETLTGSALVSPYQRALSYAESNGYRFSHFSPYREFPGVNLEGVRKSATQSLQALVRLNFAAFGWPCSFALAAIGLLARRARMWVVSLCTAWTFFFLQSDVGIDIIGPVHYTEILLPLIALSTFGLYRLSMFGRTLESIAADGTRGMAKSLVPAILVSQFLVAGFLYWPMRGRSQLHLARPTAAIYRLPEKAGIENAILFTRIPFIPRCVSPQALSHVQWWPVNDPDLRNSILYANHISLEDDRRLIAEYFPERRGFVVSRTAECAIGLLDLNSDLDPAEVGEALVGGLSAQHDAESQGWLPSGVEP